MTPLNLKKKTKPKGGQGGVGEMGREERRTGPNLKRQKGGAVTRGRARQEGREWESAGRVTEKGRGRVVESEGRVLGNGGRVGRDRGKGECGRRRVRAWRGKVDGRVRGRSPQVGTTLPSVRANLPSMGTEGWKGDEKGNNSPLRKEKVRKVWSFQGGMNEEVG